MRRLRVRRDSAERVPYAPYAGEPARQSRAFNGRGNLSLDILNVFDNTTVINFQSAFSGTRFQQGRRVLLSLSANF